MKKYTAKNFSALDDFNVAARQLNEDGTYAVVLGLELNTDATMPEIEQAVRKGYAKMDF